MAERRTLPHIFEQIREGYKRVDTSLRMYGAAVVLFLAAFAGSRTLQASFFYFVSAILQTMPPHHKDNIDIVFDEVAELSFAFAFVGVRHRYAAILGRLPAT